MGRRSLTNFTPEEARAALSARYRRALRGVNVNLVQFAAQQYEEEMLQGLVKFSRDTELAPVFRAECMIKVLTYARGPVAPWKHDGETIDPSMTGNSGQPIGQEINAVRLATDVMQEMNDLVARKVPVSAWPPHVVEAAGAAVTYYREEFAESEPLA